MNPNQQRADLREKTIKAVEGGAAWPTSEGMEDPEIVEAFRQYFESLDESGFDEFVSELESITKKLEIGPLSNKGPTLHKLYKRVSSGLSVLMVPVGGYALLDGNGAMSFFTISLSLYMAFNALDHSKKEMLGKERIAYAKSKIEELMQFAQENRASTDE